MYTRDIDTVLADLAAVYQSAQAQAEEEIERSHNRRLPLMERVRIQREANRLQELADLAQRMIRELSASAAA